MCLQCSTEEMQRILIAYIHKITPSLLTHTRLDLWLKTAIIPNLINNTFRSVRTGVCRNVTDRILAHTPQDEKHFSFCQILFSLHTISLKCFISKESYETFSGVLYVKSKIYLFLQH